MANSLKSDLRILTNLTWPSFRNVAFDIQKALEPFCKTAVVDWKEAGPGGRVILVETVRKDTLEFVSKRLRGSDVIFYGTTEGHSLLSGESLEAARRIKIVAVSGFVRQMLEEIGVPVAGVVHHGLDMETHDIDLSYEKSIASWMGERSVALTVASNDPRKGLAELLQAYRIVEERVEDSFLVLHSEPGRSYDPIQRRVRERYHDLQELASVLKIRRAWMTDRYGLLTLGELNALYELCYVYVLPSRSEGFGLSILEAFRFNKPVVAVDAPPFNEVIEDGITGRLIPCEGVEWFNYKDSILFKMHVYEPSRLAEAVVELLTDRSLRENISNHIQWRKRDWSIHRLYPKLREFF